MSSMRSMASMLGFSPRTGSFYVACIILYIQALLGVEEDIVGSLCGQVLRGLHVSVVGEARQGCSEVENQRHLN